MVGAEWKIIQKMNDDDLETIKIKKKLWQVTQWA